MKLEDITHKTTIRAICKHGITDDELEKIGSLAELRQHIVRCSRRLWSRGHKDYFRDKYRNEYRDRVLEYNRQVRQALQLFRELPHVE